MPANKSGPSPEKKKGRRGRLVVIAVVLLLVAGIGFGAYWGVSTVRASFPQTTGSLKLPGLSGPGRRASATPTAFRRSTPTPTRTSSAPRATSRPRTASGRWTYAAT